MTALKAAEANRGICQRERIRGGVKKLNATWRVTTDELLELTSAISAPALNVTFFFPANGYYAENVTMYAGDRSLNLITNIDGENAAQWEFSVNFIEY